MWAVIAHLCFSKLFFEIFTYHNIYLFKVYNSLGWLYNLMNFYHPCLILGHFHQHRNKLMAFNNHFQFPSSPGPWQPLSVSVDFPMWATFRTVCGSPYSLQSFPSLPISWPGPVLCFFLWLNSFPLCDAPHFYPFVSWQTCVLFPHFGCYEEHFYKHSETSFLLYVWPYAFNSLDIYLGVELLGYVATLFNFWQTVLEDDWLSISPATLEDSNFIDTLTKASSPFKKL